MKRSRCQKGSDAQTSREHPEADSLNSQHQIFFMHQIAILTDDDNSIKINIILSKIFVRIVTNHYYYPVCANENLGLRELERHKRRMQKIVAKSILRETRTHSLQIRSLTR